LKGIQRMDRKVMVREDLRESYPVQKETYQKIVGFKRITL